MKRPTPILLNHDPGALIGKYDPETGEVWFLPSSGVSMDELVLEAGFEIVESKIVDGISYVISARIHEFSIVRNEAIQDPQSK